MLLLLLPPPLLPTLEPDEEEGTAATAAAAEAACVEDVVAQSSEDFSVKKYKEKINKKNNCQAAQICTLSATRGNTLCHLPRRNHSAAAATTTKNGPTHKSRHR